MGISSVVPARFLTIVAHLIILIVLFWAKDVNIKSCLPEDYSSSEYDEKEKNLIIGLSVSLGLVLIELIGFMSGATMFSYLQSLFSTVAHVAGAVALSMYILESWQCDSFWYIFAFGSCLPAVTEIFVLVGILFFN